MPIFELQTPDGKSFEVDAPDMQMAVEALGMGQQAPQQPQGSGWDRFKDDVAQTASGIGEGAIGLAGMPADLALLAGKGVDKVAEWTGLESTPEQKARAAANRADLERFATPSLIQGAQDMGVPFAGEAQYPEGKYLRTGGQMIPGAAIGPGGLASKALTTGAAAIGSEGAGQLAQKYAPEWEGWARAGGALAGGIAPSVVRRTVSPLPISPERQQMVNTLKKEGVDLTAGQTSGRKGLQYTESELGGYKTDQRMERQGDQFASAALKRTGEQNAPRADPATIDQAFNRIGAEFNRLSANNRMAFDQPLMNDLIAAQRNYNSIVNVSARAPIVQKTIQDVVNTAPHGGMNGKAYQSLSSRLRKVMRETSHNETRAALKDITEALDDAMERSINPADAGAWKEARRQYRNLLPIADAVGGAGGGSGRFTPAQLRQQITEGDRNRRSYSRGQGEFNDLVRAGDEVMKPLPNSGTASRSSVRNVASGTSAILGAILGGHAGDMSGALLGAAAGTAVPYAMAKALMSKPAQAYLKNQVATKLPTNPKLAAIIAALTAKRQGLEGSIGGGDIPQSRGGWGQ